MLELREHMETTWGTAALAVGRLKVERLKSRARAFGGLWLLLGGLVAALGFGSLVLAATLVLLLGSGGCDRASVCAMAGRASAYRPAPPSSAEHRGGSGLTEELKLAERVAASGAAPASPGDATEVARHQRSRRGQGPGSRTPRRPAVPSTFRKHGALARTSGQRAQEDVATSGPATARRIRQARRTT